MKNTVQVHMLPTENKSPLVYNNNSKGLFLVRGEGVLAKYRSGNCTNQHLYFTTDEEIKEGDCFIWNNNLYVADGFVGFKKGQKELSRKIIAATSPQLNYKTCNVCGGEDNCITCNTTGKLDYIPKISPNFVEAYVKAYNRGSPIGEVILVEELQMFSSENPKIHITSNGYVIVVEERMYTRDEVLTICNRAFLQMIGNLPYDTVSFEEWKREWFDKQFPI